MTAPTWTALLRPYTLDADLTPLPGAAAPPSERTRRRLAAEGGEEAAWIRARIWAKRELSGLR